MKDRLSTFLKQNGAHVLCVLTFLVLSASFLSKIYDGYAVRQGDIVNFIGMSREALDHQILEESLPAWTGAMFSGMPTTQISHESSGWDIAKNVQRLGSKTLQSSGVWVFFMAMLSAYLMAIALGASPIVALLCGIGFGLSSFEVLYYSAGHNTKVKAIAYLPGIIAGVLWAYRRNLGWGAAIAALFTTLHISANHYQITYYALFILGAIGLTETIGIVRRTGNLKKALLPGVVLLLAGLAGALPSVSEIAETKEYATHTIRGERILGAESTAEVAEIEEGLDRDYILEYSMSEGEWWSIMCPDIKGGSSPLYWGEQKFSGGALYFGAILCALFFMFLVAGRDRLRWPLAALTAMAILLSRRSGGFLMDLFLDHVPMFNQFRDTKMMLIVVQVCVAIGAALALIEMGKLIAAGGKELEKRRIWWLSSLGFLIALFGAFYLVPESFFDFQSTIRQDLAVDQLGYPEALSRRLDIFRSDVVRTFGLLMFGAIIASAVLWRKMAMRFGVLAIALVTLLDLWNVDRRYFNEDKSNGMYRNWVKSFDAWFPLDPSPQMLKVLTNEFPNSKEAISVSEQLYSGYLNQGQERGVTLTRRQKEKMQLVAKFGGLRMSNPFRVFKWENPFNDSSASYFFQSVGGYHAAKLRRYQDFIERVLSPERERFIALAQSGQMQQGLSQMIGLRMLNTRYLLFDQFEDPLLMPDVPGFAWLAKDLAFAGDDEEEMDMTASLQSPRSAVVHSAFAELLEGLGSAGRGSVQLLNYQPDRLEYSASIEKEGLVVFSEVWYPESWTATLDGVPVETIRVNYVLRGLRIPAGDHTVEWKCEGPSGSALPLLSNLFLIIMIIGSSWYGLKQSKKETVEQI